MIWIAFWIYVAGFVLTWLFAFAFLQAIEVITGLMRAMPDDVDWLGDCISATVAAMLWPALAVVLTGIILHDLVSQLVRHLREAREHTHSHSEEPL